jgi:hypothetical protein
MFRFVVEQYNLSPDKEDFEYVADNHQGAALLFLKENSYVHDLQLSRSSEYEYIMSSLPHITVRKCVFNKDAKRTLGVTKWFKLTEIDLA